MPLVHIRRAAVAVRAGEEQASDVELFWVTLVTFEPRLALIAVVPLPVPLLVIEPVLLSVLPEIAMPPSCCWPAPGSPCR